MSLGPDDIEPTEPRMLKVTSDGLRVYIVGMTCANWIERVVCRCGRDMKRMGGGKWWICVPCGRRFYPRLKARGWNRSEANP